MQYKPIKTKTNNEEYIKNSENTKKKITKRIYIDKIVVYKPIKTKTNNEKTKTERREYIYV